MIDHNARPTDLPDAPEELVEVVKLIASEMRSRFTEPLSCTPDAYKAVRDEVLDVVLRHPGAALVPRQYIIAAMDDWAGEQFKMLDDWAVFQKKHDHRRDVMTRLLEIYEETARLGESFVENGNGSAYTSDLFDRVSILLREADLALPTQQEIEEMIGIGQSEEVAYGLHHMVAQLRLEHDSIKPVIEEHRRQVREEERQERIAAHRQPDVVMEGTKCSSCGKKPARVDDLCKKCAREAGILVHGKIGAS